jgi:hypothetical protein
VAAPRVEQTTDPAAVAQVQWRKDLAGALEEGRQSGKPILICFNMDGDPGNERTLKDTYRHAEFIQLSAQFIPLICSPDPHDEGEACSRFGCVSCQEHRSCERAARRFFYAGLQSNIAPQHLLLFPDGSVAWHGMYEHTRQQICGKIRDAISASKMSPERRLAAQVRELTTLAKRREAIPHSYQQLQAMLIQTAPERFLAAFEAIAAQPVAEEFLRELANYEPERAMPRLAALEKLKNKKLKELAAQLAVKVRERKEEIERLVAAETQEAEASPPPPEPAPAPAPAKESSPIVAERLPAIAEADDFDRVYWADAPVKREDLRGRITLIWFFRADQPASKEQVAAHNEFAREHASCVRVLGLGVTMNPDRDLPAMKESGFEFPFGAFLGSSQPLQGVKTFPAWVIVDPDLKIVFRTPQDGSSFYWHVGRELAAAMARGPAYRDRQ